VDLLHRVRKSIHDQYLIPLGSIACTPTMFKELGRIWLGVVAFPADDRAILHQRVIGAPAAAVVPAAYKNSLARLSRGFGRFDGVEAEGKLAGQGSRAADRRTPFQVCTPV
jgi:hypothetical protein